MSNHLFEHRVELAAAGKPLDANDSDLLSWRTWSKQMHRRLHGAPHAPMQDLRRRAAR